LQEDRKDGEQNDDEISQHASGEKHRFIYDEVCLSAALLNLVVPKSTPFCSLPLNDRYS
jgi:hypothetical protein